MSVYCLSVDLGAPVASSHRFLHLDGPLAYAAGVESLGRDGLQELDDGGTPEYFEDEMPLKRYEIDDGWVWAASAIAVGREPDGRVRDPEHWHATYWRYRFDHEAEHQAKRTQIQTSSGDYKSYNAALPYLETDHVVFFFETAPDSGPEDVYQLLDAHVPHLGKKGSQGYGVIDSMGVYEVGGKIDSAIYHNGRTLRALPSAACSEVLEETTIERLSCRPPYWHVENHDLCYPPGSEVECGDLTDEARSQIDLTAPSPAD